jgi:hypothetical protein
MALLSQLISVRELASLSEHQLDVLTAALDAELLSNAAVKKAVSAKIQGVHKNITAGGGGGGGTAATGKRGGGGTTGS